MRKLSIGLVVLLAAVTVPAVAGELPVVGDGLADFYYFQETMVMPQGTLAGQEFAAGTMVIDPDVAEVGSGPDGVYDPLIAFIIPGPVPASYVDNTVQGVGGRDSEFLDDVKRWKDERMFYELFALSPPIIETGGTREWVWGYIEGEIQAVINSGLPWGQQEALGMDAEHSDSLLVYEPGLPEGTFGTTIIGGAAGSTVEWTTEVFHVVPEPSVIVLLSCGALGLLVTAIRRRRS